MQEEFSSAGELMSSTTATNPIVRAARGTTLRCKGWQQEAALRCLMNNLDPEVAERPQDLVVYGGIGKAARNWECYHAIVQELENLGGEETLLREERADPVVAEDERCERRKRERAAADRAVDDGARRHAGFPKRPRGRTDSTMASRMNVKMIE